MLRNTRNALIVECDKCRCVRKSLSGDEAAFRSMLKTQAWTVKMVASIGKPSFWGWFCPTCSGKESTDDRGNRAGASESVVGVAVEVTGRQKAAGT